MTAQKIRHLRTGNTVMEDSSWTLLSVQKIGMMTALSTMKANVGTRGIITKFTKGFKKEVMRNNSWDKEKTGVDGHPRLWNKTSNI